MPPCHQPGPRPGVGIADTALPLPNARPSAQIYCCDMCHVRLKHYDSTKRMRCATCAGQVDCWYTATSWSELLQYNREYIRNERRSTAYSWFPIFDDARLTSGLLRLHDYGCLVVDARAGDHLFDQERPNATPSGPWYEMKDRAYIRLLLPTVHPRIQASIVGELETNFAASPTFEVVSYYEYAEYAPGDVLLDILPHVGNKVRVAWSIPTQNDEVATETNPQFHRQFFSTVASNAGRATSKHRTAYREEDLQWKRWKRCANNQLPVVTEADIPRRSQGKRGFGVELPVSKAVKPVVVTVVCKQWTPDGHLAELLESAMVKLDMQPLFKEEEELQSEEAKGWHKVGSADGPVEEVILKKISALSVGQK